MDWQGKTLEVSPYDPFTIRVLIRNDNDNPDIQAKNVRLFRTSKISDDYTTLSVSYRIDYDDANGERKSISDNVSIHFTEPINTLRYEYATLYMRGLKESLGEYSFGSSEYERLLHSEDGLLLPINGGSLGGGRNGYCLIYDENCATEDMSQLFGDNWSVYSSASNSHFIEANKPILNTLDNDVYGNEAGFVQAAAVDFHDGNTVLDNADAWKNDVLDVDPQQPYVVRLLLRNDNGDPDACRQFS